MRYEIPYKCKQNNCHELFDFLGNGISGIAKSSLFTTTANRVGKSVNSKVPSWKKTFDKLNYL